MLCRWDFVQVLGVTINAHTFHYWRRSKWYYVSYTITFCVILYTIFISDHKHWYEVKKQNKFTIFNIFYYI